MTRAGSEWRRQAGWLAMLALGMALLGETGRVVADDGHVEQGGERFKPNPEVLSPPILEHPIYGCADTVVVTGFVPHAELQVFVAGQAAAIGTVINAINPSGQVIKVSMPFTVGQTVWAIQIKGAAKSKRSNIVTVTDYKLDYPNGVPQPSISPATCLDCGAAVGVSNVIPGSSWTVFAETPMGAGFGPKMPIGSGNGYSYTFVSPKFKTHQRITVQAKMCTDTSQFSQPETVLADPPIPPPDVQPFFQGADIVVVQGPAGISLLDGATLEVFGSFGALPTQRIGGQPTPGGWQQVGISPAAPGGTPTAWATQAL